MLHSPLYGQPWMSIFYDLRRFTKPNSGSVAARSNYPLALLSTLACVVGLAPASYQPTTIQMKATGMTGMEYIALQDTVLGPCSTTPHLYTTNNLLVTAVEGRVSGRGRKTPLTPLTNQSTDFTNISGRSRLHRTILGVIDG